MTTYYHRYVPYLYSSTSQSGGTNLIPAPAIDDYTSEQEFYFREVFAPANDAAINWTGIYLDGWVGVALSGDEDATTNFVPLEIRFTNTGDECGYVYFLPIDAGLGNGLSTNTGYDFLLPGDSCVYYGRWHTDLYNNPAFPGAIGVNSIAGSEGTTFEITVRMLNLDDTLAAMQISGA
jgi:hypothetical protein